MRHTVSIMVALMATAALAPAAAAQTRIVETRTGVPQSLSIAVNKSAVVEFDIDIDDVIIANPEVADVAVRGPRRVAVMGREVGESNIVFLNATGRSVLNLEVTVTGEGLSQLRRVLTRHFPSSPIEVEDINGKILLSGTARSPAVLGQMLSVAKGFVENDEDLLNMISVSGKDQVLLKVRIVEMSRSVVKQLGIDLSAALVTPQTNVVNSVRPETPFGATSTGSFPVNGSISGGLSLIGGLFDGLGNYFSASLRALERVGLARTLAEPNLTAISGESAEFLAGGEFPIPVRAENNQVTVDYKPYGVALAFTPVVLSEGRISLRVATEISETTSLGSTNVSAGAQTSLVVPGLTVRRAETTVEIPSGGSLVVAGLIQQRSQQAIEGTPWLKNIPIIGALFRSRDFINEETEMVVMITPYLVEPTDPGNLRGPAARFEEAGDLRALFLGRLNKVYRVSGDSDPLGQGDPLAGPVGFVIE